MDNSKLHSRSEKGLHSLAQTVRVFSEDIGMKFGIEKCAMLVMEKGKVVKSAGWKSYRVARGKSYQAVTGS